MIPHVPGITTHQLAEFKKISNTLPLERLVELFARARHADVLPEFFAQGRITRASFKPGAPRDIAFIPSTCPTQ